MILNQNIHQYDKLEEKRGLKMMFSYVLENIRNRKSYKKLWEEQNRELDEQKLRIHRKNKQIKKLELTVEKLEKEITDLKAHRASKNIK